MKTIETVDQKSASKNISSVFLTLVDLLFGKNLFVSILINIAVVTIPVMKMISKTSGMYMYYTAETSAVGNRPCRFWGLLTSLYSDKYLFMNVFRIMYFISAVLLSVVLYQFIKHFMDTSKKVIAIFSFDILASLFFYSTGRPELSLTMMFALVFFTLTVYILTCGQGKQMHNVPALAFVAVLIDARMIWLFLIVVVIILVKKNKSERKTFIVSCIMLVMSGISFVSVTLLSFDYNTADDIGQYYEIRYDVDYDLGDGFVKQDLDSYTMSNSKDFILPESYFKVTPIDLVTEWIPGIADTLISFIYEDIFQRICYIYIPIMLIYNHLTITEEKKRKIIEVNNV